MLTKESEIDGSKQQIVFVALWQWFRWLMVLRFKRRAQWNWKTMNKMTVVPKSIKMVWMWYTLLFFLVFFPSLSCHLLFTFVICVICNFYEHTDSISGVLKWNKRLGLLKCDWSNIRIRNAFKTNHVEMSPRKTTI